MRIFPIALVLALGTTIACTPSAPPVEPPAADPVTPAEPVLSVDDSADPPADDDPPDETETRVTETGLGIEDLKVGDGAAAEPGNRVTVHYVGRLESGKVFDDSKKRGEPYAFKLGHGKVIAGWDEGVVGMKVGGLRRLTVPAKLGYGERGQMPTIPPNALLEFEIELIAVE